MVDGSIHSNPMRAAAVRDYIMRDEQGGPNQISAVLFGQTATQAIAASVATVQLHTSNLSESHLQNAVALFSTLSTRADGCHECFPDDCSCVQDRLTDLLARLAALEEVTLSISQRAQRGALEKLLQCAVSNAADDPPLARAIIGALQRALRHGAAGHETLVSRLLCAGVPNEVGLLRAAAPILYVPRSPTAAGCP